MGWRAEDSLAAALLPFDDDEGKHGSDERTASVDMAITAASLMRSARLAMGLMGAEDRGGLRERPIIISAPPIHITASVAGRAFCID